MEAKLILDAKAKLGEGALWDSANERLYWVDIEGKYFHCYNPVTAENKSFPTSKRVGTVVPVGNNEVLLALEDGLATLNMTNGKIAYKLDTQVHHNYNRRFNDGKCDPQGRFWVGSLSMDGVQQVSSLYCVDDGFSLEEKITDVSISNGIIWSLDGKLMYHIDTPTGKVMQYDFESDTGDVSNGRVVITIPEEMGYPDGMTIDSNGMLWIALWDGFAVVQYNPHTGALLQTVKLPVPKVTSCAFGGIDLNTLFITSASVEMTDEELLKYPLSGGLFMVNLNTTGVRANYFNQGGAI